MHDNAEAGSIQARPIILIQSPWWRRVGNLARISLIALSAHAVALLAFPQARTVTFVLLAASVAGVLALPRPRARIGWRRDAIEVVAGRHRWATRPGRLALEASEVVELPPPGGDAPQLSRGGFQSGCWLGAGQWQARGIKVFCAARPGPCLLVPVGPRQALLLSHREGPEALRQALAGLLAG